MGGDAEPVFSLGTISIPKPVAKWLVDPVKANEVENHIRGFAQQVPTYISDSVFRELPGVTSNNNVAGAVHDDAICLFRDDLTATDRCRAAHAFRRAVSLRTPWTSTIEPLTAQTLQI